MSTKLQVTCTFFPFALALVKTRTATTLLCLLALTYRIQGILELSSQVSGKQLRSLLATTQVPLACISTTWFYKNLQIPWLLSI